MSHIVTVDIEILDLKALAEACAELGLEFVEGQQRYRWYGRSVGDYPLPAGFKQSDLGKCDHVIRIPGDAQAYEIGVVARKDGKPGWIMVWDFWRGGYGLQDKVGDNCGKLSQNYAVAVATKQARRLGYRIQSKKLENGKVQLVCSR